MITVDKRDDGKVLVITLNNGHSAALEKVVKDYVKGEKEAMSFILSVFSEADGKPINNGKGNWVPSDELKKVPA